LFFWMTLWKMPTGREPRLVLDVSILVFLDDALKVCCDFSCASLNSGFNPCFSGWRSERHGFWQEGAEIFSFNPCFSGWRSESLLPCPAEGAHRGFNPCFSGWRSESSTRGRQAFLIYRFQSLFFWMTLWKSVTTEKWKHDLCFNPCFSGWRSESGSYREGKSVSS